MSARFLAGFRQVAPQRHGVWNRWKPFKLTHFNYYVTSFIISLVPTQIRLMDYAVSVVCRLRSVFNLFRWMNVFASQLRPQVDESINSNNISFTLEVYSYNFSFPETVDADVQSLTDNLSCMLWLSSSLFVLILKFILVSHLLLCRFQWRIKIIK